MTMSSIGDLAYHLMLRTRSTTLSQNMSQLTQELASGVVADVPQHLGGDISHVLDIERDLSRLDGFETATTETKGAANVMQTSLEAIHTVTEDLATAVIEVTSGDLETGRVAVTAQAHIALDSVLSALNTSFAGRSLFSGLATDLAPMGNADDLLSVIKSEIPLSPSPLDIQNAVDTWFAAAGGFETEFYAGSGQSRSSIQLGPRDTVELSIRADDTIFRNLIAEVVTIALAGDEALGLTAAAQDGLMAQAGGTLFSQSASLTGLRSELGATQARIEEIATQNAASRSSLEMARSALVEADPYETALKLEEVQFQLESLYTVTARSSRLSLLSYLE